jgi:hypothetical protein
VVEFDLQVGLLHAHRKYLILGSITGTAPGTPLPGDRVVLPVNWDLFTNIVLQYLNFPMFHNFLGSLDDTGLARATFDTLGPIENMAGFYMSFAFALNAPWDLVSNPINVEILP